MKNEIHDWIIACAKESKTPSQLREHALGPGVADHSRKILLSYAKKWGAKVMAAEVGHWSSKAKKVNPLEHLPEP